MYDPYFKKSPEVGTSSKNLVAITPNDSSDIKVGIKALRIFNPTGNIANVKVKTLSGDDAVFPIPASQVWVESLRIQRVYATGTTAGLVFHGYTDVTLAYAEGAPIPLPAPVFAVDPAITGIVAVGETLTATDGVIKSGSLISRQWFRGSSAISGANGSTYLVVQADVGTTIGFRATAEGKGGMVEARAANTAIVSPIGVNPTPTPSPTPAPTPTPTPTPAPGFVLNTVKSNVLVVQSKGPVSAQESFKFNVGTDTPAITYVQDTNCENEVWLMADEARTCGVKIGMVGGRYSVAQVMHDGQPFRDLGTPTPNTLAAGDISTFVVIGETLEFSINSELKYRFPLHGVVAELEEIVGVGNARWVHVDRNGFANEAQHPQITVSGGDITPLALRTSNIDGDGYPYWDINYIGEPAGYLFQIEDNTGTVVQAWRQAAVTDNAIKGKARLSGDRRVSTLNTSYTYKMVEATAAGVPKAGAVVLSMRRTRPGVPSVGSNMAFAAVPYRKTRTYTNMLEQCYVQNTGNYNQYPNFIDNPTMVDFMGNPLVSGLVYQVAGPEKEGLHTCEITAKSGSLLAENIEFMSSGGAASFSNKRQNGVNSVLFDVTMDQTSLLNGASQMFGIVFRNVETTLPKGLFCCETTDDKTKRFYKPFLDRLKALNGPIRHMDSNWANEPGRYGAGKDSWTDHRSRRGRIGAQLHGLPLEDLVDLSVLSNRPIWFNINHGLMYTTNGLDYLRRSLDLVFNGVGGELTYGVPKTKRNKVEVGNENWNFGLGNWGFLSYMGRLAGRVTYTDGDDGQRHGATQSERMYQFKAAMDILAEVVPTYSSFIDRVFGAQVGRSDIGYLSADPKWEEQVMAYADRFAIAGYLPGDPNAGLQPGQQPDSHSPEDVVAWLRTYIESVTTALSLEVQHYVNTYNMPTDLYEYNIAFPAIYQRTPAEERIIKSSQVFYDFMLNEYLAAVIPVGGDSCIYSDDGSPAGLGTPTDQSWYFYESGYTGAGNKAMDALLEYCRVHGYVSGA